MANQTIPITLQAGVAPTGTEALDLNQLLQLFAQYMSGTIRADVSFYLEVLYDPSTFVSTLIFNTTQRVFKAWDAGTGSYVTLTQFQIGDIKATFVGSDQVLFGWVLLNGRQNSAVPGLTGTQRAVLDALFPSGTLSTVSPPATTPANPPTYSQVFVGYPSTAA